MTTTDNSISFFRFMPASLFGAVMGLSGLSFAWRQAATTWGLPKIAGEGLGLLAIIVFISLSICYLIKCKRYFSLVRTEFAHPVSVSFFGTIIISLLLIPGILLPYNKCVAEVIWIAGAILMGLFALMVIRKWLDNRQDPGDAVPAWIIPVVGTLDVPIVGSRLDIPGIHEICTAFFGIGLIFTLIFFTIILSRLLFQPSLPEALQPTLLILAGPFALALSGYEGIVGHEDIFSSICYYFDLFVCILIGSKLFLLARCCPFRVGWWAVSFPMAAVTIASQRYAAAHPCFVFGLIAVFLLALTSLVIVYLLIVTIKKIVAGDLFLANAVAEKATEKIQPVGPDPGGK